MQIINILMSLGLIALGLILVVTVLQFGLVALLGIVSAIACVYSAIVNWIRDHCK